MLFVVVDAHSTWLELKRAHSASSSNTIAKLRTMFATHEVPDMVVSDVGTVFTNAEFRSFPSANNIHHATSAPYHPASNGLAENLKNAI